MMSDLREPRRDVIVRTSTGGTFSIVTPNLNMSRYLGETIESVLRNLREGDEYFVIDGGSSDNSLEVLRFYGQRLSGWVSELDLGYADAVKKGFARALGRYQGWVNAGDLLLEGALDVARSRFEVTGADFIYGDDFYVDEDGRVLGFSKGYVPSLKNFMIYGGWTPLQDACFWRSSLYEKVGGIDASLRFAADYDLFLRFSLNGKCAYVPNAFGAFRKHEGQRSIIVAAGYAEERERCRRRALRDAGIWSVGRFVLERWYGALSLVRGHILQPVWNIKRLAGVPVGSLKSQTYR